MMPSIAWSIEAEDILENPERLTRAVVRQAVLPALKAAAEVVAEQARANLDRHRSAMTGTGQYQTDPHPLPPLAEQVRSWGYIIPATGEVVAGVSLAGDVAYIGYFLEFGHRAVYWGDLTTEFVDAYPWLRPAYENKRQEAVDVAKREFRKQMVRIDFDSSVRVAA